MNDSFDLQRFVLAQEPVYAAVQAQLRQARKTTHWMWFVFPQIAGLGSSPMAQRYALSSLDEARAYLQHPLLGPRLLECTRLMLDAKVHSVDAILGHPDNLKFRSCMTLFACAAPGEPVFGQALDSFFEGERDAATLEKTGFLSPGQHDRSGS